MSRYESGNKRRVSAAECTESRLAIDAFVFFTVQFGRSQ